jgi:hypothetical protein
MQPVLEPRQTYICILVCADNITALLSAVLAKHVTMQLQSAHYGCRCS